MSGKWGEVSEPINANSAVGPACPQPPPDECTAVTNRTPFGTTGTFRSSGALASTLSDCAPAPCDDPLTPNIESCAGGGGDAPIETGEFQGWGFPSTEFECEKWKWTVTVGGYVSEVYYTWENCHDAAL